MTNPTPEDDDREPGWELYRAMKRLTWPHRAPDPKPTTEETPGDDS